VRVRNCAPRSRCSTGSARHPGPTRPAQSSPLDELTPQELQIALILGEGKTMREAGAALILSPKTIEYHLRHVYQKLDIATREALAQAVDYQRDPRPRRLE
jgi:DNA-binding CsgD family transcriptional regulator